MPVTGNLLGLLIKYQNNMSMARIMKDLGNVRIEGKNKSYGIRGKKWLWFCCA